MCCSDKTCTHLANITVGCQLFPCVHCICSLGWPDQGSMCNYQFGPSTFRPYACLCHLLPYYVHPSFFFVDLSDGIGMYWRKKRTFMTTILMWPNVILQLFCCSGYNAKYSVCVFLYTLGGSWIALSINLSLSREHMWKKRFGLHPVVTRSAPRRCWCQQIFLPEWKIQ